MSLPLAEILLTIQAGGCSRGSVDVAVLEHDEGHGARPPKATEGHRVNSLCVICLHEELVAILFPRCRDQSEYSTKRLITTCVLLHIRGSLRNWTIRRSPRPHGGRRWPAGHGWGAMRSRRPGRNGCTRPRACSPFRNVSASNRGRRRETYSHGPYTHPGVVGARCEIVTRPGRELERVD